MFNLETAIAEWRTQLLAAGIKTPVPLEELESHLREEIAGQAKSGQSEAEAFQAGVQKIGRGHILHEEFSKVTTGRRMGWAILLISGWLAASCVMLYSVLCLEINWNLLSFSPRWDAAMPGQIIGIVGPLAALWFLAKASHDRASRAGSLLICLLLMGIAAYGFHLTDPLRSGSPSPLWFRSGRTLVLCLPGVFWIWWKRRRLVRERTAIRGSRPVRSN